MLALKKKREAEAKAKAEEELAKSLETPEEKEQQQQQDGSQQQQSSDVPKTEKVSLLGIGGKKKVSKVNGDDDTATNKKSANAKKRTPGEIRIQKGKKNEIKI